MSLNNSGQHFSLHFVILWFVESYPKPMIFTICICILFNILRIPCNNFYHWAMNLTEHSCQFIHVLKICYSITLLLDLIHSWPWLPLRAHLTKVIHILSFGADMGFFGVLVWLVLLLMLTVLFVSVNGLFVVDG